MKSKPSPKKILLTALVVVLAIVFTALLGITLYFNWMLNRAYDNPATEPTLTDKQKEDVLKETDIGTANPDEVIIDDHDEVIWDEVAAVKPGDHILNILLVGQDRRPGEIRARSDTMMLITIDTEDRTVTMTSFLRDMYVQIPGTYPNRINVPYALEGHKLLFDTMELNFGIRPHHYMEVDFEGFEEVVELVGGVDMELTEIEANYLNRTNPGFKLKTGKNHLNGAETLAYVRIRSIDPTGDFARTERQRKVIGAIIKESKKITNLIKMNELLLAVTEVVSTDMTPKQILSYAASLFPILDDIDEPVSQRIPYENAYYGAFVEGIGHVLVPDLKTNSEIIAKTQE